MKQLKVLDKPYDDEKMKWNEEEGQYVLTFEYAKENYEPNFKDDNTLKRRLKKNSRVVYDFISSRINSYNKPLVIAILSRTEEGRKFIFKLLRTQFESDVDSGYNDLGISPAVNLANGQVIPREEILRNTVSVDTEKVWDNNQEYFGINIAYQGMFPPYYFYLFRNL